MGAKFDPSGARNRVRSLAIAELDGIGKRLLAGVKRRTPVGKDDPNPGELRDSMTYQVDTANDRVLFGSELHRSIYTEIGTRNQPPRAMVRKTLIEDAAEELRTIWHDDHDHPPRHATESPAIRDHRHDRDFGH